jgi:hypothetical protein
MQDSFIDASQPWLSSADTGLSSGIKNAVQAVHGKTKLVPIYDNVAGVGETTEFRITGWGVVVVVDSKWTGEHDTRVRIKKSFTYNGKLKAQPSLSNNDGTIEGAFTIPVLVQ